MAKKNEEKKKVVKEGAEKDTEVQFYDKKHKSLGQKIWDVVFWTLFAILAFVWIYDYIQVSNDKEPKFCIKNVTHTFDDGTVDECDGLGYKVYQYHRSGLNIKTQFSPFFIGMKEE
jgi:hypothetical protein